MAKMNSEIKCKQLLIDGLSAMGLKEEIIPSLIRSIRICYAFDPKMGCLKTNRQLHSLGWNDIELNNQILKLSRACFVEESLSS
jgi:hypothetical protein